MSTPPRPRWFQFGLAQLVIALSLASLGALLLRCAIMDRRQLYAENRLFVSEQQATVLLVRFGAFAAVLGAAIGVLAPAKWRIRAIYVFVALGIFLAPIIGYWLI